MKALRFVLVGAIVVVIAGPVLGAERPKIEAKKIQLQPKLGVQADAPLLTPAAVEKIKFTEKQKEDYAKIESQFKDKTKAAQEVYRAAIQGERDREKFKEAQDKLQTDSKKAREDSLAKVEPILTDEQKTVFAQVKNLQPQPNIGVRPVQPIGGGIGKVLPLGMQQRLQLTDEQKKQIEAIQKEVEAKVLKVLTDEQKKQLETMKKGVIIRPQPIQRQPIPRIQPAVPNAVPSVPAKKD